MVKCIFKCHGSVMVLFVQFYIRYIKNVDDSAKNTWLRLCTFTFTEGLAKRCALSHVSTCSLTPGYEEIRLGPYPIPDKK